MDIHDYFSSFNFWKKKSFYWWIYNYNLLRPRNAVLFEDYKSYNDSANLIFSVQLNTVTCSWYCHWACSFYHSRMPSKKIRRRILMYKSSRKKQKYLLTLSLTWVSLKSMCFHTATYRSFLSFCDRDGRQRSIPSGPFWQIEWREYNLLFLEGLLCGIIEYAIVFCLVFVLVMRQNSSVIVLPVSVTFMHYNALAGIAFHARFSCSLL